MHGRILSPLLLCATVTTVGFAQNRAPELPPEVWSDMDRTLLGTTCVVRATIRAADPLDLIRAADRGGSYVRLELQSPELLTPLEKGEEPPERLTFFAAPSNHPHGFQPCAHGLRSHLDHERLLLLQRIGDRNFLTDRFRGTSILGVETAPALRKLMDEHRASRATPLPDDVPHEAEVRALLDQLVRPRRRASQAAWDELQRLPMDAIPALVKQLKDPRKLPDRELLLRRGTYRDLTISAHCPTTAGQAVLLLLHHLSGESIGSTEPERATPEQLVQAASSWNVVAHRLLKHGEDHR